MTPRYALARRRAQELLARAGVSCTPVNVYDIARRVLGAEIREEHYTGQGQLSGMAYRRDGAPDLIGVNESHSEARKRFTIAHEIGHLVMHADRSFHVDQQLWLRNEKSSAADDACEIEANQFASELLMPSAILSADLERGVDIEDEAEVKCLAEKYGVSVQAMNFRLARWSMGRG